MRPILTFALTLGLASQAAAWVDSALDRHILPGFDAFADASSTLAETAHDDCRPEAVRPAYQAAFDAWMSVADLRLGPSETGALSVAFWPDPRGFTQRTLTRFIAEEDPIAQTPEDYSEVSIAARGFFALDMLLYDPDFADYAAGSYTCDLVIAIAADLDRQAETLSEAWRQDFAVTLRNAGAADNTTFLTEDEALRALYTQVLSSLEFTAQKRLGLPMGSFDRPRPALAEARRSERSLRNVHLAAEAAHGLATVLADWPTPEIEATFQDVLEAAARIQDPAFQDVADPQARLRLEVLQQAVMGLREAVELEIGASYGIEPGFNSQDGD